MYAYVFGEHGSDVSAAIELVGQGEEGDRIRAVAEVTIGEFGSVVAIEAPDMKALDSHVSALSTSGTYTQSSGLVLCAIPDCAPLPTLPVTVMPAYLPPYEAMAFVIVKLSGPPETWPDMRSTAFASGVEAGGRRALLEFGADDVETIQADLAAIGGLREVRGVRAAYFPGSKLTTAEGGLPQGA